jgi:hypothetical protein
MHSLLPVTAISRYNYALAGSDFDSTIQLQQTLAKLLLTVRLEETYTSQYPVLVASST